MMTKIYLCPSDKKYGCSWEGQSDDILEHFIQEHEDILYYTNSVNINLDVTSENSLLFVDTEIYLFQTKIIEMNICIFLRYLGPAKIAAKITFDLDLFSNGEKLDKNYIEMKDGYFRVSLEALQAQFGDVNNVNGQLLISGDFKSNSSDDGVFLEDEEPSLGKEEEVLENNEQNISEPKIIVLKDEKEDNTLNEGTQENSLNKEKQNDMLPVSDMQELKLKHALERNISIESNGDLTPCLENLFSTPVDENSLVEIRASRPKSIIEEGNRSTWYDVIFGDPESPKTEHSSLQRSKTFGSEDVKRRNVPKRHPSVRSLGAIKENETDLRCLGCDAHLASPIFLCESDHNICANCYRTYEFCTVCESKITSERNLELEEKAINYEYNCKYKKNGCPQKLIYQDVIDHEINCTFCTYICPMEECGYKGPYKSMFTHLNLIHSSVKMYESFIAVFHKHTELFLANEKMGIFYCTIKTSNDTVAWHAKFCGPKERKFFCELKFKGKNFKAPFILVKQDDCYIKEIPVAVLKEQKAKSKNSILAITR